MSNRLYSQIAIGITIGSFTLTILLVSLAFWQTYQQEIQRAKTHSFRQHIELKTIPAFNSTKDEPLIALSQEEERAQPQKHALDKVKYLAVILLLHTLLLLILVLFIIKHRLIKPIDSINDEFNLIISGQTRTLSRAKKQTHNQICCLVEKVNHILNNMDAQIKRERKLKHETEQLSKQFKLLFDKANVGIGLIDKKNHLIVANPRLLGLLTQSYIVNNAHFRPTEFTQHFQHPSQVTDFIETFRIKYGDHFCAIDTKLRHKPRNADTWVHCLLSKVENVHGSNENMLEVVLYDITVRSQREKTIIHDAEHDMLTGLYNRRASLPKLEALLEQTQNRQYHFALLMIDLDGFKAVNDTYGHDAGDKVIIEVARRIKQYFRGSDVVTRWGGDEFLIGFSFDPTYSQAVNDIATHLQQQICLPICIGRGQTTTVGSSIGISLSPAQGRSINALIEKADLTMYKVKQHGKNDFALYQ